MRTLTWFIRGGVGLQTDVGPAFRLDVGYHAVEVWLDGKNPGLNGPTVIGQDNHIYQFTSVGDDPQDK